MPVRAGTRPSPPSLTACPRLSPPPAHLLRPLPGLALPKYEGKEGEQLLAKFAELEKSTADVEVAARKRITELEAMLAALGVEKAALKTLTVDQVLAADKELANTLNTDIVRPACLPSRAPHLSDSLLRSDRGEVVLKRQCGMPRR